MRIDFFCPISDYLSSHRWKEIIIVKAIYIAPYPNSMSNPMALTNNINCYNNNNKHDREKLKKLTKTTGKKRGTRGTGVGVVLYLTTERIKYPTSL